MYCISNDSTVANNVPFGVPQLYSLMGQFTGDDADETDLSKKKNQKFWWTGYWNFATDNKLKGTLLTHMNPHIMTISCQFFCIHWAPLGSEPQTNALIYILAQNIYQRDECLSNREITQALCFRIILFVCCAAEFSMPMRKNKYH